MTAYKNFVEDFPTRCREVLKIAREPALLRGREVTLTLIVASAGLMIPYERLKPDGGEIDHPSGDNRTFSDAAEQLKSLLDHPFLSSKVWGKPSWTWHSGKVKSVEGAPSSWVGFKGRRPFDDVKHGEEAKTVKNIIGLIRNALAHGNIYTYGDPIEAIIFVKINFGSDRNIIKDYSFISVSPDDFLRFLDYWFDFLGQLKIPQNEVFEALKIAA